MTRPEAGADLLVVDAPAACQADYQKALADVARSVSFASSGEDVGRAARERSFPVVLVHLDGPDGTHADAVRLTRALCGLSDLPVIFVSQKVSQALSFFSRHSGPFDYLAWPIVPELAGAKIGTFIGLRRAAEKHAELERERDLLVDALESEKRRTDALVALAGEHVHRGKNLLAIIQSISLRTVSDGRSIADARSALLGRLRAIARAYHMATATGRAGAELHEIVEAELGEAAHRVVASGPSVRLKGGMVQTFTLVIHELTTNALAYGALSTPAGSVAIGWTFFDCGEESYLEVDWTEANGPPVVSPERQGFGLSLVATFAGTDAELPNVSFDPSGFVCRLRLSQDMIAAD